ncbi:MAG: helix-turn-helix domain-containing protein [Polyangiaceae bacterium]|nr:helix-turn-helix domain-containing protein [Polyangiaceae bacterium]
MSTKLGTQLKQAREKRGLRIAEVARQTRIPVRSLELMEEGRFDDLPGEVFVRGFLRSYAVSVGLVPDEILALYASTRRPFAVTTLPPTGSVERVGNPGRRYGVAVALVLLLLLFTVALSIVLKPRGGREAPPELSQVSAFDARQA